MCYAIAPHVAGSFIQGSRVMTGPVDLFIKRFWEHKQPLFFLFPPAVDGSGLHRAKTTASLLPRVSDYSSDSEKNGSRSSRNRWLTRFM